MAISKEGEKFISDLTIYLMTSGKSDKEIKEFIEEAEEHLELGEKDGKSIEDIFGSSPEEYAKSVEKELSYDKKELFNILNIVAYFLFAYTFLGSLTSKDSTISLIHLIATPTVYALSVIGIVLAYRKFVFNNKKSAICVFLIFLAVNILLIVIDKFGPNISPSIHISQLNARIGVLLTLVLGIIVGFKSKTILISFIPFIINVEGIVNSTTNMNIGENNIYIIVITFLIAIFIMMLDINAKTKKKDNY